MTQQITCQDEHAVSLQYPGQRASEISHKAKVQVPLKKDECVSENVQRQHIDSSQTLKTQGLRTDWRS
jgi:hypothetical protein